MHEIFDFPSMLSYCPMASGWSEKKLEFSVKKCGGVKLRQEWWEKVEAYAQSRVGQVGYREWFDELVRTDDVLVCPKLARGVALPQDGLECGDDFIIPEPSRKKVVTEVLVDACDTVESVSGDIVADDPMDASSLSTPGDSPANISVLVDEVDAGVSPDVVIVATVSCSADDELELRNAYNQIDKLQADVAAATKLQKEQEMRIQALESDKRLIYDDGERKYRELYEESKEKLRRFLVDGDYWRRTFMEKASEDIRHANSYDSIMQQGELYEKALYDMDNA